MKWIFLVIIWKVLRIILFMMLLIFFGGVRVFFWYFCRCFVVLISEDSFDNNDL